MKRISRKSFIEGAVASAAALSAMPLVAASADEEVPASLASQISGDAVEVDVVVCGTGTAGTCAALRGAELGLNVAVLEANAFVGGSSRWAEGVFGVGDRLCQEQGVDVTPREIVDSAASYAHYGSNGPVLKCFIDNAGDTINWLMDHGIPFTRLLSLGGSPATWHTFDTGMLIGENLIDPLLAEAQSLGAELYLETAAKELAFSENGSIAGVYAQRADGTVLRFVAPVVILATGGYGDNREMFERFVNVDFDSVMSNGAPGHNGDGIQMGLSAGAALHLPSAVMFCGGRVADTPTWYSEVNLALYRQYNMRVNENGSRYWNEARVGDFTAHGNSLMGQRKNISIIDQAYLDILMNEGLFYGTATMGFPTGSPVPALQEELEANPNVVIANTIAEIAEAFGIDSAALEAEVERYNGFCEIGVDEDYGKPADYLQPVKTPPFYAANLIPTYFTTVGGLKVNPHIQVCDEQGQPIKGLYACGSDAGGVYGHCYDVSAATGSQQGWAATSARLAVEHAAADCFAR